MEYINITSINLLKETLKIITSIYLSLLTIGWFAIILGTIIFFFSNRAPEDSISIDL